MYTLICGSPKIRDSNSMKFLGIIKEKLNNYRLYDLRYHKYDDIISNIYRANTIVLAFLLYVDSPPSLVLSFLDYIVDNNISLENKLLYVVVNCGFREGEHNICCVNIIKRWCNKTKAIFGGSIMIGAGEIVGKDRYRFIAKKALRELDKFSNVVRDKTLSIDMVTTMDLLNNEVYCYLANSSWYKKRYKYRLSKSDLFIK